MGLNRSPLGPCSERFLRVGANSWRPPPRRSLRSPPPPPGRNGGRLRPWWIGWSGRRRGLPLPGVGEAGGHLPGGGDLWPTRPSSRSGTAPPRREYIYRGPYFAILLAFLGTNILCAALIRFPWKKRQTGFVITHAGLLIVLAGVVTASEPPTRDRSGCSRATSASELVRVDHPVIRVWEVDPHTQQFTREIDSPFLPGAFSWGPGRPRLPVWRTDARSCPRASRAGRPPARP